ncbi:hypothetical protein BDV59DRAFT_62680 [Aspergillus ambiguus]|uniref:uncharacterized protein n=1 Tax=Aspergillus ambiguus TaxID=176160 RepID=UPI003CCD84A5
MPSPLPSAVLLPFLAIRQEPHVQASMDETGNGFGSMSGSNFTFTFSPGHFVPLSRPDGSTESPSTESQPSSVPFLTPRTSPPPSLLFQNLNIRSSRFLAEARYPGVSALPLHLMGQILTGNAFSVPTGSPSLSLYLPLAEQSVKFHQHLVLKREMESRAAHPVKGRVILGLAHITSVKSHFPRLQSTIVACKRD